MKTTAVAVGSRQNKHDVDAQSGRSARGLSGIFIFAAACEMAYHSGQWYMDGASSILLTAAAYAIGCIAMLLVCCEL